MPMTRLNLPITLFASTMGLGGLALLYSKIAHALGLSEIFFSILKWTDSIVFLILAAVLILRLVSDRQALKAEYDHPLKINFFAAVPISMFLLSALWQDHTALNTALYFTALVMITLFTLNVAALWFRRSLDLKFLNPAWFIPVVGNVVAIFTAVKPYEWLWYYFAVGCTFYILLLGMILFRMIFSDPMPEAMKPTLFIFIAPPSLCCVDMVKMTGSFGEGAMIFLSLAIFFTLLIAILWKDFIKIPFTPSWWAFTFPLATLGAALMAAYENTLTDLFLISALLVFAALFVLVLITAVKTIGAIVKVEIA